MTTLDIPTARIFLPLLEPARHKAAYGGRGSGKSHFFAGLAVEDSLRHPGENGGEGLRTVCLREVQKDLKQSAKLLIEDKLRENNLGRRDGFRIFTDVIQTPGDGIIIFKGMQEYTKESIKSLEKFKRAWCEEAHTLTQGSIDILGPTIREEGSELWWSWNPRRKNDPVDIMFRGIERPTGASIVATSWRHNPWWTAELEQQRLDDLRMKPDQYDHIWEGGYVTVSAGSYYAADLHEAKIKGRIGRVSADPLMTIRAIWDIGGTGAKADACAIWIAQFAAREIRVLDYYEAVGQPLATHVGWLRDNGYDKALCVLPHDGETQDSVFDVSYDSALRSAGFKTLVIPNQGRGAAKMRIEATRRLFPSIWFNEATTAIGREMLGWYHEKKHELGHGLGPEHDFSSHGADAFGLMCVAYEAPTERKKPKEVAYRPGAWMG